jgi:4-hydroxy-tetrahydrodipicolinate synthase
MVELSGVMPALITPFRDGAVDEDALRAHVVRQLEGGVSALVPCGTTGEAATLTDAEHQQVVRAVVEEAAGRVPVLAGCGTASTAHSIELAERSKAAGADGLLLVMPYYLKPTQAGLEAHVRAVVGATGLPTMLYNIPGRSGVDLSIDTLGRLADVPAIVAIKEATKNVLLSQAIRARFGDRFQVFSGDDGLGLPILAIGGAGVVSVTANAFPAATVEVVDRFFAGELDEARRAHLRLLAVHEAMFVEANPGPVKALLAERGLIAPEVRLPLVWPQEASIATLRAAVAAAGIEA